MIEIKFTKRKKDMPGYRTYDTKINGMNYSVQFVTHVMPEKELLNNAVKSMLFNDIQILIEGES